jgi:hypothetical protein
VCIKVERTMGETVLVSPHWKKNTYLPNWFAISSAQCYMCLSSIWFTLCSNTYNTELTIYGILITWYSLFYLENLTLHLEFVLKDLMIECSYRFSLKSEYICITAIPGIKKQVKVITFIVGIREPTIYVTILFAEYKITLSKSDWN